jgi:tRNA dimethylallyltransferase
MNKIPFLIGPTASGKTAVSIIIATLLNAEIISADSRQLYKGMTIGTAQPTPEELEKVPHHFIACIEPHERFSAGEYGRQARSRIESLYNDHVLPLVVGGSGLYLSALIDDFFSGPSADPDIRVKIKAVADGKGLDHLYSELLMVDPVSAAKILPGDYRRIERALEIFYLTGIPISQMRQQASNPPDYEPIIVGLHWERPDLYDRIGRRCLKMLDEGLIDEVKHLLELYPSSSETIWSEINALNSVGYVEAIQYLSGQVDYDETVRLFQRNTRRFAKRQLSWFRRNDRIHWIKVDSNMTVLEVAQAIIGVYHNQGIASLKYMTRSQ